MKLLIIRLCSHDEKDEVRRGDKGGKERGEGDKGVGEERRIGIKRGQGDRSQRQGEGEGGAGEELGQVRAVQVRRLQAVGRAGFVIDLDDRGVGVVLRTTSPTTGKPARPRLRPRIPQCRGLVVL